MKRYIENENTDHDKQGGEENKLNQSSAIATGDDKNKKTDSRLYNGAKAVVKTVIVFLAVSFVLTLLIEVATNISSADTDGNDTSLINDEELKEYTSVKHGFKAKFPGFPESEEETLSVEGYQLPYILYTAEKANGDIVYMVAVYDYSSFGPEGRDVDGMLEGAVNGAVQSVQGARLISSNFTQNQGYRAIEGFYSMPIEDRIYDGYILGVMKGEKLYAMFTIGAPEAEFNSFVDSFTFTN